MRLMPISAVPDGSILGRDIISGRSDALPLLRAGTKLSPDYCRRLTESGIHAVYIDDAVSDGIVPEPLVTAETRAMATKAVARTYENARATIMAGQSLGPEVKATLTSVLEQMLAEVSSSDGVARVLTDLSGADAYTFQHSIDVTALGLLIGQKVYRENGWTDFQGRRRYDRIEERL